MKLYALIALSLASAAVADPPAFKQYSLRMSLDDFKSKQLPEMSSDDEHAVICTDDSSVGDWIAKLPGTTACDFAEHYTKYRSNSWSRGHIRLAPGAIASTNFTFFEKSLMKIDVWANTQYQTLIEESLETKFGKPNSLIAASFQTKSGAIFPQVVKTWIIGTDKVILTSPDLTLETVSVQYVDTVALSAWDRQRVRPNAM